MNNTLKMGKSLALLAAIVAGGLLTASCEDHVAANEKHVVNVYNAPVGTAPASSAASSSSSSYSASSSTSGSWSGKSATGQVSSKMSLSERGGSISGTLQWPNDRRSVSGAHRGGSLTLYIGGPLRPLRGRHPLLQRQQAFRHGLQGGRRHLQRVVHPAVAPLSDTLAKRNAPLPPSGRRAGAETAT